MRSRIPLQVVTLARIAVACAASVLAACATSVPGLQGKPPRVYEQESFDRRSAFSREFVASPADTCAAARRALLSQGYVVDAGTDAQMDARKRFQPDAEIHVSIEFHVVCTPIAAGNPAALAFASAVQDRFTVKKTAASASVGVSPFGSLSLPVTSTSDSLVKVGSETISTAAFYERFFDLVEQFLAEEKGLQERPAGREGSAPQGPSPAPARPR